MNRFLKNSGTTAARQSFPAIKSGAEIKNNIKSSLSKKYGELDTRHIFDGIDDKDIEDNISTAENAIRTNIDKGTLGKDFATKLPNLRDGLALSYAAANKGNNKAAKRAREAAYMEVEPLVKETGIKLLSADAPKPKKGPYDLRLPTDKDMHSSSNYKNAGGEKPAERTHNPNGVRFKAEVSKNSQENSENNSKKSSNVTSPFLSGYDPWEQLEKELNKNNHSIQNMTEEQIAGYESRKVLENSSVLEKEFWDALSIYGKNVYLPNLKNKTNNELLIPGITVVGELNKALNTLIENNEYAEKTVNNFFNSNNPYSAGNPLENYEHNKKIDLFRTGAMSGDFINKQSKLSNFKFGIKDIDYGGCGVIATYNVLKGLGENKDFADVIYENENSALIKGGLGLSPSGVTEYLRNVGFDVTNDYIGVDKNYKAFDSDAVIHLYFRSDGTAHYVAGISNGDGTFCFYNSDSGITSPMTWEAYFEETIDENRDNPIAYNCAYRIKK